MTENHGPWPQNQKTHRVDKLTAHQASTHLREAVRDHFRAAQEWVAGGRQGEPPVLGIKSSAGVGKTEAVLRELASPEWAGRRVLMLEPSIDLCEQVATRAKEIGVDARVIRGRSQPQAGQPEGGERMCAKWELAEALSALSIDVTNTLCKTRAEFSDSGEAEVCPFAETCPYLAQLANKRPGLLLAAHQYISLSVEGLKAERIDLVIVDETFWQSMCRTTEVSTSQFQRPRGLGKKGYQPKKGESRRDYEARIEEATVDFEDMHNLFRDILHRAQGEKKPLDLNMFRDAGFSPENCAFAAGVEYSRLGTPNVSAGMAYDEQAERIKAAKVQEAYSFARIWKILAAELPLPRSQLLGLVRNDNRWNPKTGAHEDVLELSYHAEARISGIPLILIDADLDEDIASQFYPVAGKVLTLDVEWQNVKVRQVIDRTVSRNMLAGSSPREDEQQRHENRREDLWWMAQDMAERHGHPLFLSSESWQDIQARCRRPLLVTYKGVEDRWIEDERLEELRQGPKRNALPFDVTHLGAIRGMDDWKQATGIIVAGRLEPTLNAIERLARAVYHRSPTPLAFVQPEGDLLRYSLIKKDIIFRDGKTLAVDVASHPDPRIDAVLRQVREAEVLQALARVRPVHRTGDAPCEIIVATNVPLPGLIVDEAVAWADLVPDRIRRMMLAGVLPDLAADCAAAYPDWFASPAAVRQARSRAARARPDASCELHGGCDKAHLEYSNGKCHTPSASVRLEFLVPLKKGNREGSATLRLASGDTEETVIARLRAVLPQAHSIRLVDPLPCPENAPEPLDEAEIEERKAIRFESAMAWLKDSLDADLFDMPLVSRPLLKSPFQGFKEAISRLEMARPA